jgi:hypothetical protein
MREDLGRYSNELKNNVQRLFLSKEQEDREKILAISDPFKVPCIIIAYWCGEVSGYPDYLKKSVDSLMKFYGYTEILNKPEGCP